ncbi:MAG: hypothetical protein CMP22_06415 [Rickettsiales bacterium]|nr:hypothetical protein [Rickettsiales bacterium]
MEQLVSLRLDSFLHRTRFFKSKSIACKFCEDGHVRINGHKTIKPHFKVKREMVISFSYHDLMVILKITALPHARIPAKDKINYFEIVGGECRLENNELLAKSAC